MEEIIFDWDELDIIDGNTRHILDVGVDPRDVEDIILDQDAERELTRTSAKHPEPRYLVWGVNSQGDTLGVVYERGDDDPRIVRPVTAWIKDR